MQTPATSFWHFSLSFYAAPSVAETCLDLQDRLGMDVNLVLYLLWRAHCGRRLSADDITSVIDLIAAWQENVVRPLRGVRRFLKTPDTAWPAADVEQLRQRIKAQELEAERLQHITMQSALGDLGAPEAADAAATFGLKTYAQILGSEFPDHHLVTLLRSLPRVS
ncbi:MAG: TIGR02444 family protein [Afipia sp.]|mgnify:CR=1 FL=1|nr:TIGR02444 family protein [Afipia sp.]OJW64468.1 MAG: TIGR02444 family protein [Afipia sp. 64-13]